MNEETKLFNTMRYGILTEVLTVGVRPLNPAQLKSLTSWFQNVDRNSEAALQIVNFIKGYLEHAQEGRPGLQLEDAPKE